MTLAEVFLYADLTPPDQLVFAKMFQTYLRTLGQDRCWCIGRYKHVIFEGFSTAHKSRALYKKADVRPLLLAFAGEFQSDEKPVAVRRAACKSIYCLNPSHYYWGTRQNVSYETAVRNGTAVSQEKIDAMKADKAEGKTALQISRKHKLPYHVARRLCNGETYDQLDFSTEYANLDEFWSCVISSCNQVASYYKQDARSYKLAYLVTEQLTCPWHHKGSTKHKGNFGLMGECLDCMEEMKKGRCTVDVRQFDLDWYWQVKRFWEQVDVKAQDQCWPWLGATRRQNKESLAYFPSPFHSGKIQSAPRVALWLSRGYTGKYRVSSRTECAPFCCNPLHLTIRELKGHPAPIEIEAIHLKHDNVFQYYRENQQQVLSDLANELSST